jgi:hypothetical protein
MQGLFIGSESIDTTLLVLTSKHKQGSDCDDKMKQVDLTPHMGYLAQVYTSCKTKPLW